MIKANDLRLGNWVKTTHNDFWEEYFRGVAVKMELYLLDNLITTGLELFEPIELTAELLGKVGFHDFRPYHREISLKINEQMTLTWFTEFLNGKGNMAIELAPLEEGSVNYNYLDEACLYLHQLQNLFYALTGTELSITL